MRPAGQTAPTFLATDLAIALDGSGIVHISYAKDRENVGEVWYAKAVSTDPAGGFAVTPIATSVAKGGCTSIALDAQGKPGISYIVEEANCTFCDRVRYASNATGSWVIDPVATAEGQTLHSTFFYQATSTAMNPVNGRPALTYAGLGPDGSLKLWYAEKTSTGWTTEVTYTASSGGGGGPGGGGCEFGDPECSPFEMEGLKPAPVEGHGQVSWSVSPMPFRSGDMRVTFTLQEDGVVGIGIYDVGGRRIAERAPSWMPKGAIDIVWDVHGVKSGIYFIRAQTSRALVGQGRLVVLP